MREIVSTLGAIYPAMFRESKQGRFWRSYTVFIYLLLVNPLTGYGPVVIIPSLNGLGQRMIDRVTFSNVPTMETIFFFSSGKELKRTVKGTLLGMLKMMLL